MKGRGGAAAKPGDEDVSRTSSRGRLLLSDYPTPEEGDDGTSSDLSQTSFFFKKVPSKIKAT